MKNNDQLINELQNHTKRFIKENNYLISLQKEGIIMLKNKITLDEIRKIKKVLEKPLEYYQTDNKESSKNLLDKMLKINVTDDTKDDLKLLMSYIKQSNNLTTKQLNINMWNTIERYYLELQKIIESGEQ